MTATVTPLPVRTEDPAPRAWLPFPDRVTCLAEMARYFGLPPDLVPDLLPRSPVLAAAVQRALGARP